MTIRDFFNKESIDGESINIVGVSGKIRVYASRKYVYVGHVLGDSIVLDKYKGGNTYIMTDMPSYNNFWVQLYSLFMDVDALRVYNLETEKYCELEWINSYLLDYERGI